MELKAILIKDINRIIEGYSLDIRLEKNKKAENRLLDEQAMYKFVLRNAKQVSVTQRVKVTRHMDSEIRRASQHQEALAREGRNKDGILIL